MTILIENGANINAKDSHGESSIHWAAKSGFSAAVRLLIDRGADIYSVNEKGKIPFEISIEYGNPKRIIQWNP